MTSTHAFIHTGCQALRLPKAVLVCALLLALAGCGPGVGGSGTGPDLVTFGATAAPVCGAPFALALRCDSGVSAPDAPGGTAATQFVDQSSGSQVVATLRGSDIELDLRCPQLYFYGRWGTTASGVQRYFGGYTPGNGLSLVPAQLAVAQHGPGGGFVVQLLDASGAALTAPVRLQPAAGAVPGAATGCP